MVVLCILITERGGVKERLLAETTEALNSAVERETGILNEIREATRLEFVKRVAAMEKELREKGTGIMAENKFHHTSSEMGWHCPVCTSLNGPEDLFVFLVICKLKRIS